MEEAKTTIGNILGKNKKKKERKDFYIPDNKSNEMRSMNS